MWNTSSAEQLQFPFPRSIIVGAFKNFFWEVFDGPRFHGKTVSDVFVIGNDQAAKQRFVKICAGSPFRYIDSGVTEVCAETNILELANSLPADEPLRKSFLTATAVAEFLRGAPSVNS